MFAEATGHWHDDPSSQAAPLEENWFSDREESVFRKTLLRLHRANFELWHQEDKARDPSASDAQIADVKRSIDGLNQRRNDLVEHFDGLLLASLEARKLPSPKAKLHSETPGMMLDRLSILALKIYHTQQETERLDAPEGHVERNRERLLLLRSQRDDSAACLDELWADVLSGRGRFKLYRQLKMYNDPALNPVLYSSPRK